MQPTLSAVMGITTATPGHAATQALAHVTVLR
jgi:hypothetical protein